MSSTNKDFKFERSVKDGKVVFSPVGLLRFSELEPHLVVAHESEESTEPFDLEIEARVTHLAAG